MLGTQGIEVGIYWALWPDHPQLLWRAQTCITFLFGYFHLSQSVQGLGGFMHPFLLNMVSSPLPSTPHTCLCILRHFIMELDVQNVLDQCICAQSCDEFPNSAPLPPSCFNYFHFQPGFRIHPLWVVLFLTSHNSLPPSAPHCHSQSWVIATLGFLFSHA